MVFLQQPRPSGLVSFSSDSTHIIFKLVIFSWICFMESLFPSRVACCLPLCLNGLPLGRSITSPYLSTDASSLNQVAVDHNEICWSPCSQKSAMVEKCPHLFVFREVAYRRGPPPHITLIKSAVHAFSWLHKVHRWLSCLPMSRPNTDFFPFCLNVLTRPDTDPPTFHSLSHEWIAEIRTVCPLKLSRHREKHFLFS